MLKRATEFRDSHIFDPKTYDELKDVVQNGWAFSWWCGSKECEAKVKEDTKATTSCIPLTSPAAQANVLCAARRLRRKFISQEPINDL